MVLNSVNTIVSARDGACPALRCGNCWGYPLECRSTGTSEMRYQFTGKEREWESDGYYYYGARYYNSLIGRWLSVEPLLNKYPGFSPYIYTLNNPIIFSDPTGLWVPEYDPNTNTIRVIAEEGDNLQTLYSQLGITADDFGKMYDINNVNDYRVVAGETSFDITNFVFANTNFSSENINMNCFSFSLVGTGAVSEEMEVKSFADFTKFAKSIGFEEVREPKAGSMITWVDPKGETQHSAIYIIKSKSGVEYYVGRPGQNSDITLQTSTKTQKLYRDYDVYYLLYVLDQPFDVER